MSRQKIPGLLLLVFFPGVFAGSTFAQTQFDDKSRAEYINDVVTYVTWPNEVLIDTFRLGVLATDSNLYLELKKIARERKIHDKPVSIRLFTSLSAIKPVQILFLRKESGFDIDKALYAIRGENTLLISENFEFNKSMINFIVADNKKRFQLNQELLKDEGFAVTVTFAALAVQTEADWKQLYKETNLELILEKHLAEEQRELLARQKLEIQERTLAIEKLNQDIMTRKEQLDKQNARLAEQKARLTQLVVEAVLQQKLVQCKIKTLDSQSVAILKSNLEIATQEKILISQNNKITRQKAKITTQNELIEEQNARLLAQGIAIGLFVILLLACGALIFLIYRSYKNKKESNRILQEKNEQISKQNDEIRREKERSDKLLLNILPVRVADDLKQKGHTDPQVFRNVTVLFSDIVGFTRQSSRFDPGFLIGELNELFTAFDMIIEENHCERIKTIGDAYLAVCGMPVPDQHHAENMMKSAVMMLEYLQERNARSAVHWEIRIGLHSGEVVGGVVGIKKYIYDVFGDTINTASRMESNSDPMQINVSDATFSILKNKYVFEERDPSEVRGKGKMKMYFLIRDH